MASQNINTYRDVEVILRKALSAGGGRYRLASPGAASHWRMRAYTFRKLLQRQEAAKAGNIPGHQPSTFVDTMLLRIDPEDRCVVVIRTQDETLGELILDETAQAKVEGRLELDPVDDPALLEALKLAEEKGI